MAYAEKTCQKMCFLNIFGGAGTNLGYASIHHQLNIFLSVCQFFCLSVYLFICLSVGLSNFISVCLSISANTYLLCDLPREKWFCAGGSSLTPVIFPFVSFHACPFFVFFFFFFFFFSVLFYFVLELLFSFSNSSPCRW